MGQPILSMASALRLDALHAEGDGFAVDVLLGGVALQGIEVAGVAQHVVEDGLLVLLQHLLDLLAALAVDLDVVGDVEARLLPMVCSLLMISRTKPSRISSSVRAVSSTTVTPLSDTEV